ncbi:MAG: hypothetical protein L3J97_04625 [Thermoplasmata archaeon]|nr:hypothetical protein [Thermoplasmata archaeon]
MSAAIESAEEGRLLGELRTAVASAPHAVKEIEVGIALSIALGRIRPAVACGGCEDPLAFEGIPARTNTELKVPFRLVYTEGSSS